MDPSGSRSSARSELPATRCWIVIVTALVLGSTVAGMPISVSAQQDAGSVVGQPDVTFSTASGAVTAGTATELSISITNRGKVFKSGPPAYEDQVTTARAMTLRFKDENVPISVQSGERAIGSVPVGSTSQSVPITVAKDAPSGTYRIPIEYGYLYTRHVEYDSDGVVDRTEYSTSKTGSITVAVKADARFEVIDTTGTAQVGDTGDVAVRLRNTGTRTAHGASVVASSSSGSLTLDAGASSASAYVGEWAPGDTRAVTFETALAPNATVREYTMALSVRYEDADGIDQRSRSMTAGIEALPAQSFTFSNVESTLRVGTNGEITGTIRNEGPDPVADVMVSLGEGPLEPRSGTYAIGELAVGETATFRFTAAVPETADPVPQRIDIATNYRTADETDRRVKDPVRVEVAERRDAVTVRAIDAEFAAGEDGTLAVEITNQLDIDMRDVRLSLVLEEPLESDFRTTVIPSLQAGEVNTVTFDLGVDGDAPASQFPATVEINYTEPDGDVSTARPSTVTITVTAAGTADLPIEIMIFVVLAVLVVAGGWWFYGR